MRILIVEDDERIADFIQRALKSENHSSVQTADGREALELCKEGDFETILLDLMLPGISGLEICQQLRMRGVTTPIIMLTAMDSLDNVTTGLRMGADDYMTKPFAIDELLARIDAIGRRGPLKEDTLSHCLEVGSIKMDRIAMQVSVDGINISLTAKELAILELLMSQPGRLYSRERILNNIWGMDIDPLTNVVDVYISRLRKKVCNTDDLSVIETVRGMGYRMNHSPN